MARRTARRTWVVTTLGFTLSYLGYGLILLALVCKPQHADTSHAVPLPLRALAFVGYYSYSIYLWHEHLARYFLEAHGAGAIQRHLPAEAAWLLIVGLYIALSVGAGALAFYLIEWPSLAIRNRLAPSAVTALPSMTPRPILTAASEKQPAMALATVP